jgi:hypothetical protein
MNPLLTRAICALLVLLLSGAAEPLLAQQPSGAPQDTQNTPATDQNPIQPPIELPDSPGRSSTESQQQQAPAQPSMPAPQSQNQKPSPQPSGTAAAPAVQVSGSAASKPAGVAIAPPKQRQIRSLLIKLGFIAGAGAALGTVMALSAASPGRVPNSPGH